MNLNTVQMIVVMALPLIFAIVLHEVAHGWVADMLGDHTARERGRLTLNPISHIDLFGTIIMPLILFYSTHGAFVFGYAKPVPINPYNFKNPRKGMALSSMAGPAVNFVMAVGFALLFRLVLPVVTAATPAQALHMTALPISLMFGYGVFINVVLGALNLIPIPPLDGSRIVYWLLPEKQAAAYYRLERFGMLIIIALFLLHILDYILWPVVVTISSILLGKAGLSFLIVYLFKG